MVDVDIVRKNVIDGIFKYYIQNNLDDESDFFPVLKNIIKSMSLDTCDIDKKIESYLIEMSRQKYIDIWIDQAKEESSKNIINIQNEKNEALKVFNKYFVNKGK
jgi:hypothetical protein